MKTVRRGFVPEDERFFSDDSLITLKKASKDIKYLIDNGYPIKSASTFVGDHYLLSERQRLAIVRSISSEEMLKLRREKQLTSPEKGSTVHIDGFNTIITLEVAYSGSPLFEGMDGCIRDLAGLRGTYRIVDKTMLALEAVGKALCDLGIGKAVFYIDKPVSNSGRLAQLISETFIETPFETETVVMNEVDFELKKHENVISGDAIILDECKSWINFVRAVLEKEKLLGNAIKVW